VNVSKPVQQVLPLVAGDTGIDNDAAGVLDGRQQGVSVGVRDLARSQ